MIVQLTSIHWIYLLFILIIIIVMLMRKDTTIVCILGIFIIAMVGTASLSKSVMSVFNGFIYAAKELMGTIFIISIITAMSKVLMKTGINELMVAPFTKIIKTPTLAYWTIGILMMIISWFFWPSPAVALLGAILLPVAVKVGLPPIGAAIAMNLFGHGIALSSDFIIQGAPKLTADAAGIPVSEVTSATVPLILVMGAVTTISAYYFLMKDIKKGNIPLNTDNEKTRKKYLQEEKLEVNEKVNFSPLMRKVFAILIPIIFLADIIAMYKLHLQGGDATAIIGGTATFILILISMLAYRKAAFEKVTSHIIEGLTFGFKIFGPVLPIAAFFYIGDSGIFDIIGKVLPQNSQGIVNDLGMALAKAVPVNSIVAAITLTSVGAVTGLDGSGFSGISLAGSTAKLFSTALGGGIGTLTALGQIAAIWVGGGTLIPWALIPAAAICGVNPFDMARKNLKPVVIGLVVTTLVAIFII